MNDKVPIKSVAKVTFSHPDKQGALEWLQYAPLIGESEICMKSSNSQGSQSTIETKQGDQNDSETE